MYDTNNIALLKKSTEELKEIVAQLGEKPFRAKQLYSRLMKGFYFDEMTELSIKLREQLKNSYTEGYPKILEEKISGDGTKKYLFEFNDKSVVEGVLLKYEYGCTACISTQVGCAVKCSFCVSGKDGFFRNLTGAEIYSQALMINKLNSDNGRILSNIVLMGSGEPLNNYNNVIDFFKIVSDEEGLNVGIRNISVSTVGISDKIIRLADSGYKPTLCLSLHAPNDEIRRKIIPKSNQSVEKLIEDCKYYFSKTGRRVIIEYILIDGVNAGLNNAKELANLLTGLNCHINLIPKNGEMGGKAPNKKTCRVFLDELKNHGKSVTMRRTLGEDIEGACGQLKAKYSTVEGK